MPSVFSADWRNELIKELKAKADQSGVDAALSAKADKAATLAGYGITDAYTKPQVDDGFQPLDATLTALAGLDAAAGILHQSGADTFSKLSYETGTSIPTVTAASGTITSATASLRYTKLASLVTFRAEITISNNGTGASYIVMTLPFVPSGSGAGSGIRNNDGSALSVFIADKLTARIFLYDHTYPGSSGTVLTISGSYFT